MSGMVGLSLQRRLLELGCMLPIITITGHGDVALALGISMRTVEVHKARLMDKLGVDNVADLVRISMLGTG